MVSCLQTCIGGPGICRLMVTTPRSMPFAVTHCGWKQCVRLPRWQSQHELQEVPRGKISSNKPLTFARRGRYSRSHGGEVFQLPVKVTDEWRFARDAHPIALCSGYDVVRGWWRRTYEYSGEEDEEDKAAAARDASSSEEAEDEEEEGIRRKGLVCWSCSRCRDRLREMSSSPPPSSSNRSNPWSSDESCCSSSSCRGELQIRKRTLF
uniref:Uncharacterized protein n=1 Tax=Anopheles atroparvus TaxID=41427 RepID=A0A182IY76_ANOAO